MKTYITTAAAAALLIAASSCTTFHRQVKTETHIPDDREQVKLGRTDRPYTSAQLAKGTVAGDWAITEALGRKASGPETPYIIFEPKNHRVYGSNGCNIINADYKYNPADSTLSFSNVLTTMRACPDATSEADINTALNRAVRYTWGERDSAHWIYLYDAAGTRLMSLMHQDFYFLNGAWRVASINGVAQDNPDMTLVFDIDEMKVHGNTGCNILNGQLSTKPDSANSISFQQLATTRMACPPGHSETAMLVALEETVTIRPVTADKAEFLNSAGTPVMTLVRTAGEPGL